VLNYKFTIQFDFTLFYFYHPAKVLVTLLKKLFENMEQLYVNALTDEKIIYEPTLKENAHILYVL
jgi:hypothetical protein